jgi:hypothetical protein
VQEEAASSPVRFEAGGEAAVIEQRLGVLSGGRGRQVAVRGEQQVAVDQEPAAPPLPSSDRRHRRELRREDGGLEPLRPCVVSASGAAAGAEAPARPLPPHSHYS